MSSPPPRRRRRQSPFRVVAALFLALLAHAVFVGILLLTSEPRPIRAEPPKSVALRAISSSEWEQNRAVRASSRSSTRPLSEPEEPEPPETGQYVTVSPGNDQRPKDADLLAAHDNTVEKESLSRERTPDYKNPQPRRTTNRPQKELGDADRARPEAPVAKLGVPSPTETPDAPGGLARVELPAVEKRSEIALRTPQDASPGPGAPVQNRSAALPVPGTADRLRLTPGGGLESGAKQGSGQRPHLKLLPSAAAMDAIIGAPANDLVDGIEEGDETALNTVVSPFAGYMTRISQTFSAHYRVEETLRVRDPTLSTYLYKDRTTSVDVEFDPDGKITEVRIAQSSGVDFLDQAVADTFRRMETVPNMPRQLAEKGGFVLRFGFTLMGPNHRPILRFERGY